jgi:hypothetical protein
LLCGSQSTDASAEAEPCDVAPPLVAEPLAEEPVADCDALVDGWVPVAPAEALPDWLVLLEDCDRWLMFESCVVLALPDTSPTFTLDLPRASMVVFGFTCTSVEDDCWDEPDC